MSLNGLDAPEVRQVHDAVLNEAGGWFLLKYVSRDGVELLDHGNGGVSEARTALAQYEELSPLYGLIMYRRKKVLIKYVPEGTSRLLQARTTVHLQDVSETYSPYETMVEITSAEALSDTTLAAAFPLHTAAPSIKGNKLDEISEGAEEPTSPSRAAESPSLRAAPTRKASAERWPSRRPMSSAPQVSIDIAKSPDLSQKSSVSRFLVREESGHQSVTQLDSPPMSDNAPSESSVQDTESIISNKSGREPIIEKSPIGLSENGDLDFEKYYAEMYKPKVRLGPRPVTLSNKSRRPMTASTTSSATSTSRPVSTMPAGLHVKSNSATSSQMKFPMPPSNNPPSTSLPALPGPPPTPTYSLYPPRPGSRGSARSLPASTLSIKTSKSTMTPEKMRLMKAMELRKKQMRRSTPAESTEMPTVPENVPLLPSMKEENNVNVAPSELGINKADSGISMNDGSTPEQAHKRESDTQDSHLSGPGVTSGHDLLDHTTPQITRAPRLSLELSAAKIEPPKGDDPFSIDSPTLGRTPDTPGALQRSTGLSSLLGVVNSPQFQMDSSVAPANEPSESPSRRTSDDDLDTVIPDPETKNAALQKKRRGWVEPLTLNVDTSAGTEHEHNYLSDDDFLEELQSATFQEANMISIQRSPASPFFPPRRPSAAQSMTSAISGASLISIINSKESSKNVPINDVDRDERALPAGLLAPDAQRDPDSRAHSIASAKTLDSERSDHITAPHRSNVSSGISKRIQALAEKSAREGSPTASSSPRTISEKSSSIDMRKSSLRDTTESPAGEKRPASRPSGWATSSKTPMAQPTVTVNRGPNRDSVSVTARIVRQPAMRGGSVSSPTELHHSPLLINHTRTTPVHEFPPMAPLLTNDVTPGTEEITSPEPRDRSLSPTFSYSSVDSGNTAHRKSFDRKSFTSRYRSGYESPKKGGSKHASTTSLASEGNESEKASRTSRFFRRISTIGGSKRKSVSQMQTGSSIEPTIEVSAPPPEARSNARKDSVPDIPPPIAVGDLNVQFPDTLLWKRRWVEIDSAGNLTFTASRPVSSATNGRSGRSFVTKFHLNDLRGPYVPDLDAQEMPHSVLFDLDDGATLCCASEDSMAQRQLMSLLNTYRQAWTT